MREDFVERRIDDQFFFNRIGLLTGIRPLFEIKRHDTWSALEEWKMYLPGPSL